VSLFHSNSSLTTDAEPMSANERGLKKAYYTIALSIERNFSTFYRKCVVGLSEIY